MVANPSSALWYGLHSSDPIRTPTSWSTALALSLAYTREVPVVARLVSFAKNVGGIPSAWDREPATTGGRSSCSPELGEDRGGIQVKAEQVPVPSKLISQGVGSSRRYEEQSRGDSINKVLEAQVANNPAAIMSRRLYQHAAVMSAWAPAAYTLVLLLHLLAGAVVTAKTNNGVDPGPRQQEPSMPVDSSGDEALSALTWMATGSEASKAAEAVVDWHKHDSKRMLHAVYRVGDLDRTIKYYTECFGMKLLRKRDVPDEKYTNAFLGFGPENTNFAVELTYNYGVDKYDIGTGFGHFAIANDDVYKLAENIKSKGGKITREPGPVKGGSTVIAFAQDPDGYMFELIQRADTPEPLCQVMLRVGDLERSIKFYEKALGMKLLRKKDVPDYKYTIAMLGYADEDKTTVLELTYNYGVTEYSKGNAYAQVAIGTNDVYKSAEAVDLATKELGGKILRQPGPLPGINTKIASFVDPDGWKVVLVDNTDFLKELH
ncbi:Lactoylglutathione lyase [Zea mays]|uniref:Lactoylglutathione lyase n=2 Tax=Zea mays TaxID=4577 RepID=A0A3L6G6C9_MAIZE|nr:Lactoylglutathione lyase [Zea mays]